MYSKIKALLETIEHLGEVEYINMDNTYASIEFVADDGKSISLTMRVKEEEK